MVSTTIVGELNEKMSPMSEISSISSTSTTAQRRKIKKPLIEKRRRLRINQSLAKLKSLVLEATKKDENCFPKMEKADILEMTVAYMKTMNHRLPPTASCPASLDGDDQMRTYLSGFQECAMQVCSFLMDESTLSVGGGGCAELCGQLSRHLSGCFHRLRHDRRQNENADDDDWRRRNAVKFRSSDSCSSSSSSVDRNPLIDFAVNEKKFSGDDRGRSYPSSASPPPPPVALPPLLSPPLCVAAAAAAASSTTDFKTEIPRSRAAEEAASFIPATVLLCIGSGHESSRDWATASAVAAAAAAAKTASHQPTLVAFDSRTRVFASSHSTAPLQTCPHSSSLVQQQHPSCVSPMKGEDFPLVSAIPSSSSSSASSSAMPVAVGLLKSTLNPHYEHFIRRDVLPAADMNSSIVWRPW